MPPRPPQTRKPNPLKTIAIVAAVAAVILVILSVVSSGSVGTPSIGFGDSLGVLEIEGAIGDGVGFDVQTRDLIRTLKRWAEDDSIRGLVVRINSPGGTVGATQELYHQLIEYRKETGNPVVASFGDISASGGYYTAMACDVVYANPGTLTGSIGVILRFMNYQDLTDKVGLQFNVIKSGEFKDIGSGSRPMTEEEKELLQTLIDDVYTQFLEAVTNGRRESVRALLAEKMDVEESEVEDEAITAYVKRFADGRIFSGKQAYETGFIDALGPFEVAVERCQKLAGLTGKPKLVSSRRPKGLLESLTGETRALIQTAKPGQVTLEYRFALP